MTTTQRPRTPRRTAPPPGPNPASRGIILIVVGVVLGLILLAKGGSIGFDDDGSDLTIDTEDASTTTTASTTTVPTTDRPPQSVKVVVANGSDVSGLAAKTAEFLATTGYTSTVVTDSESQVSATVVYFAPGFEASAQAIARDLGLPESQVQALPPGAQLAGEQPADAGVVLQLGPEIATKVGVTTATTVAGGVTSTTTASGTSGTGTNRSSTTSSTTTTTAD